MLHVLPGRGQRSAGASEAHTWLQELLEHLQTSRPLVGHSVDSGSSCFIIRQTTAPTGGVTTAPKTATAPQPRRETGWPSPRGLCRGHRMTGARAQPTAGRVSQTLTGKEACVSPVSPRLRGGLASSPLSWPCRPASAVSVVAPGLQACGSCRPLISPRTQLTPPQDQSLTPRVALRRDMNTQKEVEGRTFFLRAPLAPPCMTAPSVSHQQEGPKCPPSTLHPVLPSGRRWAVGALGMPCSAQLGLPLPRVSSGMTPAFHSLGLPTCTAGVMGPTSGRDGRRRGNVGTTLPAVQA